MLSGRGGDQALGIVVSIHALSLPNPCRSRVVVARRLTGTDIRFCAERMASR
jgi:hypothetical protein